MGKSTIKWLCVFLVFKFLVCLPEGIQFIHRLQNVCYNPSYQALVTPMILCSGSRSKSGFGGRSSGDHGSDQFRAGGPAVSWASWALGALEVVVWRVWRWKKSV